MTRDGGWWTMPPTSSSAAAGWSADNNGSRAPSFICGDSVAVPNAMAKDYVCGMDVDEQNTRYFSEYDNKTWYFCSPECKRNFDDHPDHYIRERTKQDLGL